MVVVMVVVVLHLHPHTTLMTTNYLGGFLCWKVGATNLLAVANAYPAISRIRDFLATNLVEMSVVVAPPPWRKHTPCASTEGGVYACHMLAAREGVGVALLSQMFYIPVMGTDPLVFRVGRRRGRRGRRQAEEQDGRGGSRDRSNDRARDRGKARCVCEPIHCLWFFSKYK